MLTSLSLIFLVGLAMGAICQRLKLPRIIGMLVTGIILGPYVLDFLDPSILSISAELRKMALIIILLKAGLSLDLKDLKKAGRKCEGRGLCEHSGFNRAGDPSGGAHGIRAVPVF